MASSLEWREWIAHSNFSFLVGASHPSEMLQQAAALGYRGIAFADFDGVYGLARAHRALVSLQEDGKARELKLFHGAEIHFAKDHAMPVLLQDTLVLLAQSFRGYSNLCRLLTQSHRGGKKDAHLLIDYLLAAPVEDVVAIQPMRGLIRRGEEAALTERSGILHEHFKGRFYFAISRHLNPAEDDWIAPTLRLARQLEAPCLLTQDAFFNAPERKEMSDLLHGVRTNRTLDEIGEHFFPNAERCLRPLEVLERRYRDLPIYEQALAASCELAESFHFNLRELRYHYPREMLPEGFTTQEFLEKLTGENAKRIYGEILPQKVESLLRHELELVEKLDFADYFLTIWDIVRWAREQKILCQGRGSAANSAVCFVLGITSVNPALFDVLFERFLSVERGDPPDIDVDFEHERREEVIQYIYRRYGREKAAMVANVITFQMKGAIKAVKKTLGKCKDHRDRMVDQLYGFPRHLGIHSGGFVLSDRSLDALVVREPATMEGRTVIQWCKDDIEALGFFKIDILALGMLTSIRKCLETIESHYVERLTLASIPPDDKPTYDMICAAKTVGVFQIESRAQMSMLPRLQPRNFYDLVVEVAIVRPGPIQGKMVHPFLRRRKGEEKVNFPDPRLVPILERTLGVPIFQEQVMRIAMAVGDFTGGEANELRRNMGAFSLKGKIDPWLEKLERGMRKNGIAEQFIQRLRGQMEGFSHYGFPESHAASFGLLAYASAYLKRHYPAAFFVTLLNSQPMGFYSPHVLLQTAQHEGVPVLPVCIVHSDWDFKLEREPGEEGWSIRMGFRMVKGLHETVAKDLVARRRASARWESIEDVLKTVSLARQDLTTLAAADVFAAFGTSRRSALWLAERAPRVELLDENESQLAFPAENPMQKLRGDFAATSTTLGRHPVELQRSEGWTYAIPLNEIVLAKDLVKISAGGKVAVFGMTVVRQRPIAAKGMFFATIEDETGMINLVVRPDVYKKYRTILRSKSFLCVAGILQRADSAQSILVREAFLPSKSPLGTAAKVSKNFG